MGISRKEAFFMLDTASDSQLKDMLLISNELLRMSLDKDQISELNWVRSKIIEELNARNESNISLETV